MNRANYQTSERARRAAGVLNPDRTHPALSPAPERRAAGADPLTPALSREGRGSRIQIP